MGVQYRRGVTPLLVGHHGQFHTPVAQRLERFTHLGVEMTACATTALVVPVKLSRDQRQVITGSHSCHLRFTNESQRLNQERAGSVANPVVDLLLRNRRQINVVQRIVDRIGEIEKLRTDVASLRGQVEVLSNEINNSQRRHKDFYNDLDQRLRKLEPQRLTLDGKDVEVDKAEQKAFDTGLTEFRSGNFTASQQLFSTFLQRYPDSGYMPQAYFWLGSSHFAKQECDKAIPAYQTVAARFPLSQKAPEALLNIASCQLDLKDKGAARETLDQLLKKYPSSSAASMGKERLSELK